MSPPPPHNSAAARPSTTRRAAALALLPALAAMASALLAALLPEDVLWLNALRAVLLTLPHWLVLGWLGVGAWAWRAGARGPGAAMAALGLALAGLPPLDRAQGPGLRVVAANVQAWADDAPALERALAALEPDVALTFEHRAEAIEGLVRVAHNDGPDLPKPSHGASVWCRESLGCEARITPEIRTGGWGMPVSLVRVAGRCLVGVHAPPPVPLRADGLRPYVNEVARHIADGRLAEPWAPCVVGDPVVVLGDLNYVPGSRVYRALRGRGLRDPAALRGVWGATWPAGGGWPDLPFFRLDHALVGDLPAAGLRAVRLPGSDHKALVLRLP